MALNNYVTQVRRLLHDATAQFYPTADVNAYINEARKWVAAEGQCIRVLPPSGPGQNQSVQGQEVYTFASVNSLGILGAGVASIQGVVSISVSQGTLKPTLRQRDWSWFQAMLRSYNVALQNFPTDWAQYGQGVGGSVYLWPIPSQASAMDWDCYCLPIDLANDSDPEAIPEPWPSAIKYYAAKLAFENAQRFDDADRMEKQYEKSMKKSRAVSEPPFVPDMYDGG